MAGAVAGIVFGALLITSLVMVRSAVPADPHVGTSWSPAQLSAVGTAVHLVPFAAIAFLWFIGVLRLRMGELEDRFFATVFLGSGLLFLTMLLGSSAVAGALIDAQSMAPHEPAEGAPFAFARTLAHDLLYVNAMRLAGVFMISTSTIALRTRIVPRWMAAVGLVLALVLLFGLSRWPWIPLVFPGWVIGISTHVLVASLAHHGEAPRSAGA